MSECIENKGACGNIGNVENNRGCGGGNSGGIGNLFGSDSALLFFFLILVIIFCNCGIFSKENGSELLFFFLLLVVLFSGGRLFGC